MKHSYLGNKSWTEITREERYFCFELFDSIRKNPKPFLELICKDELENIEVAVEVCFYRDLLFDNNKSVSITEFPQKRTFDLAIFAKNEIIIFEAKVSQGFKSDQLEDISKDKKKIEEVIKTIYKKITPPTISIMAITSSIYKPKSKTIGIFDEVITWKKIANIYDSEYNSNIFSQADSLYGKSLRNKKNETSKSSK